MPEELKNEKEEVVTTSSNENEQKVEEVKEETKVEEKTNEENISEEVKTNVEEKQEMTFNQPIDFESEEKVVSVINTNASKFNAAFKSNKKLTSILMVVFLVLMLLVMFLLGNNSAAFIGVIIALVVVYFAFTFIYGKNTKKKLDAESNRVIEEYFSYYDSYTLSNEAFENIKFNSKLKLDPKLLEDMKIVKDISHIGGRNLIKGTLDGIEFQAGDGLIKTKETNEKNQTREYIVFLGKLFFLNKAFVKEGRAIIYLKGKGANGPTDIDDLTLQENLLSEKYQVYSSCNLDEILTEDIKKIFDEFEVNDNLIDMFIVLDDKQTTFGFSYSDAIMTIPLFNQIKLEELKQYKDDVDRMVRIVSLLNTKE